MKSKVYFTKEITKEAILKMYQVLEKELNGNVAVKVHSGEAGNQNYIKPEMYEDVIKHLNGTVIECNTAYDGERNTTKKHQKLLEKHNWTKYYKVDLLDAEGIKYYVYDGVKPNPTIKNVIPLSFFIGLCFLHLLF